MKEILKWIKENPAVASALVPFLMTGVFAAASATFEMYRAYITGVPWGQSHSAMQQTVIWENNFECMQGSKFHYITNDHNVQIGTLICPTGDVLISAKRPDDQHPSFKWVSWNNVSEVAMDFSFLNKAHAYTVIDSYYSKDGYLVQEVLQRDGICIRYYINTYTGEVVRSEYC